MAASLNFCDPCSEKRVREVKVELEQLFHKKQVNLLSCGICCCEIPLKIKTELDVTDAVSVSISETNTKHAGNVEMKIEPEVVEQTSDVTYKEVSKSKQDVTEGPDVESDDDFVPSDGSDNDSDTGSNYSDELESKDKKSKATTKKQKQCQAKDIAMATGKKARNKLEVKYLNPEFTKHVILEGSLTTGGFTCKVCEKDYKLNGAAMRKFCLHLGEHEELGEIPKTFKCHICTHLFGGFEHFKKHIKDHLNPTYYYCTYPDCNRKFKLKESVPHHVELIHKGLAEIKRQTPRTCHICDAVVSKMDFKSHLLGHEEFTPLKCDQCGQCFLKVKDLNRHQKRHDLLKTSICETCGKAFYNLSDLATHRVSHTHELIYQCEYCPYRAKRMGTLRNHIKNIHTESDPNKCKCNYCGLTFLDATACTKHQKKHETGADVHEALLKRFQCTECGYRATKPCKIRVHMRSHTGEKPFQCVHCEKGFTQRGLCNRHMKVCKKR